RSRCLGSEHAAAAGRGSTCLEDRSLAQTLNGCLQTTQRALQGAKRREARGGDLFQSIQLLGFRSLLRVNQRCHDAIDIDTRSDTQNSSHVTPRQKYDYQRLVSV